MSIQQEEESLFAEWREKRPGFVADGVVDENAYLASSPKLLFILKEVNAPGGGDWDLRSFLRDGGRAQTWNNITRWVEGIRNIPSDFPWSNMETINETSRRLALQSIAAINLKKSPGGHTTDRATLAATAAEDRAFLNRQFGLYEPDIVLCCGSDTSDTFHRLVTLDHKPEWKSTRRGVWFHEFKPKRFIVQFAHPEARVADTLLFYGLIDAIREIVIPISM